MRIFSSNGTGTIEFMSQATKYSAEFPLKIPDDVFQTFERVEYTAILPRYINQIKKATYKLQLSFDEVFYTSLVSNKCIKVQRDGFPISIGMYRKNKLKIQFDIRCFINNELIWSDDHAKIYISKPKVKVAKSKHKGKELSPYAIPRDAIGLYNAGYLFHLPNETARPRGRNIGGNAGGSKNINANYIGKINQGGKFTPK